MGAADRLFLKALYGDEASRPGRQPPPLPPPVDGEDDEPPADPTEAERVLAAFARRDFAACLALPPVALDAVGRPQWAVSNGELARAYRRASLRVHPDKNASPDARAAFDAVSEVQRLLLASAERAAYLREAGEKLLSLLAKDDPVREAQLCSRGRSLTRAQEELARLMRAQEACKAEEYAAEVRAQAGRLAARCVSSHAAFESELTWLPLSAAQGCGSSKRPSARRPALPRRLWATTRRLLCQV